MEKPIEDPLQTSVYDKSVRDVKHIPDGSNRMRLNVIEDSEGRKFHGGGWLMCGPDQMLLTRMLKGIIPVSDVVYIKDEHGEDHFFSYELPLDSIESSQAAKDHAYVDVLLLREIFHDYDHRMESFLEPSVNIRGDKDKRVFFDFDRFARFWLNDSVAIAEKTTLPEFDHLQRSFLRQRLDQFTQRFEGEAGKEFLEAIVHSIPKSKQDDLSVIERAPGEDKIGVFQEEILRRIESIRKSI